MAQVIVSVQTTESLIERVHVYRFTFETVQQTKYEICKQAASGFMSYNAASRLLDQIGKLSWNHMK